MGLLPKPYYVRPRQVTALATAWQIGLVNGRLDHPALDQLLGPAECWADGRRGDRLAMTTFP